MKNHAYSVFIFLASLLTSSLLVLHRYFQFELQKYFDLYHNMGIYFGLIIAHLIITLAAIIYLVKNFKSVYAYIPVIFVMSASANTYIWINQSGHDDATQINSQVLAYMMAPELKKLSPEYDVVFKALYDDGHLDPIDIDKFNKLLNDGQYVELEDILSEMHRQTDINTSHETTLKEAYYSGFGNDHDDSLEYRLNMWVDTTGSYQSYTARAVFLHNKAWTIRGNSYFKDIPADKVELMTSVFNASISDSLKALELNKRNPVAYIYLIYCHGVLSNDEAANRLLEQALEIYPDTYYIREAYLNFHLSPKWGGTYTEMFKFSQDALNHSNNNPRLAGLTAETIHEIGKDLEDIDSAAAIDLYNIGLQFAPLNDIYMSLARVYRNQHDVAMELEQYNRVINKYPRHPKALVRRSLILVEQDNKPQAITDARLAITLDKGVWVTSNAGWVFETAEDYTDALTAYTLAIKDDPHYAYPYDRLVMLHIYLNKDYASAFNVAKAMTEYFPENPNGWLYAADYAYDLHNREALNYINKYFDIINTTGVKNKDMHDAAKRLLNDINKSVKNNTL